MELRPDVIVMQARHEVQLAAHAADIHLTVQGSSLVTGRAALKKAKEVSALVAALGECGLAEGDIALTAVHAEISSGLLGRSSSASYGLRLRCTDLELLPEVLGAVTSAKTARLDALVWRYADSAEQEAEWLRGAIARANIKAAAAAAALGVQLGGVHHLASRRLDEEVASVSRGAPMMEGAMVRRRAVDLGFELGATRDSSVEVTIEYRVG